VAVKLGRTWTRERDDPSNAPTGTNVLERSQPAMEMPQVRPGAVKNPESKLRVLAFFHNAAEGNLAIQLLTALGIPNDRMGITPPEQIEGGQGMILSIGCPDERSLAKAEETCRKLGGKLHRQRA
jgi:hypothetical protein